MSVLQWLLSWVPIYFGSSSAPTPVLPTLPNEILDLIVDAAADIAKREPRRYGSSSLLCKLALTSRSTCARARVHIFRELHLSPTNPAFVASGTPMTFLQKTISIFRGNKQLFTYVRSLTVVIGERFPSLYLELSLPFFLDSLRGLDELILQSPVASWAQGWSKLDANARERIVKCIAENRLKTFGVKGFFLPPTFLSILPPTVERIMVSQTHISGRPDEFHSQSTHSGVTLGSDQVVGDATTGEREGQDSEVEECAPRSISLMMTDTFTLAFVHQPDSFFRRLTSLEIGHPTEEISVLCCLLELAAPTLKELTFRYEGHSAAYLESHNLLLEQRPFSKIPPIPNLERLTLVLEFVHGSRGGVSCPPLAANMILHHLTVPAFSSVHTLAIEIDWPVELRPLTLGTLSPVDAFFRREDNDFASVDTLLSEGSGRMFGQLKEVELVLLSRSDIMYVDYRGRPHSYQWDAELRRELVEEAKAVFRKTIRSVDRFTVITDKLGI